ncbi:biotin--[acetyl-CoA-carboxylase] synthetase [Herbaspirillum hiltneri N3]|uniref:biotin--[biotin carboxyl-carrier protein] ligase n=1 Tax=Herbaspirillum hiltneri N3 TaxID=1262470 RepID=A0ABM5UX26_9BURK|nr:biotin--[acetyl-CoA-carboxylase] ligase [Herbaspirillum hiltneri]AKZ61752.1 biotin--[acetyl-CoA-carboxylase] synthetase [Herbaspirillum hiltneri N3]
MCAMDATETSLATTISAQRIAALIASSSNENAKTVAVEVVAETGSTNADLLARVTAVDGGRLVAPVLLVAESQTAGRGRAGRPWQTTRTSALTFSLAWKFNRPLHALIGLPLAVGVVLAEALGIFGIDVELKWPNDVLRDGAKLAGILIETAQDKSTGAAATWTVIGIGVNLTMPPDLQQRIGRAVADVSELLTHERERLLAILLSALADALADFDARGFAPFVARWNRLHAYTGRTVRILDDGRVLHEGVAVGVDEQGCFLMDTASGRVAVTAGDVSLRLQE